MRMKRLSLLAMLLAPGLLTGCPVYIDSYDHVGDYDHYDSPDVVVVGGDVPSYIQSGRPTYTYGSNGRNPLIQSFTPNLTDVRAGQPITFTVVAADPDDRPLQFNWAATGGTLSTNSGRVVSWDPPEKPGTYTITVVVSNSRGGVVTGSLNITLKAGSVPDASPTPAAVVSATPVPASTVQPSATPAPQATPTPTVAATPTPAATATATPVPQDPEKASIGGTVRDDAGPLDGAEVSLVSADESVTYSAKVLTPLDGHYHFANVPAGVRFTISATKTGYGMKQRIVEPLKGKETVWDFDGTYGLQRL